MGNRSRKGSKRDLVVAGAIWIVFTVLAEAWALNADLHPLGASNEAEISDEAFNLLVYLGIPVFTLVLTALAYSIVRFRARGDEDGAPVRTHVPFVTGWVAISSFLAVFVIFNPGFVGLDELEEDRDADLTIEVLAKQWNWTYDYAEPGVVLEESRQLVLPSDTRIRFLINSDDVLHSFWVPAFRIKIDAVPGKTTETWVTITETGSFDEDPNFRVQCAELCGTGHARMASEITVMEPDDFDSWAAEMREGSG